jgi:hypothetical protein
MPKIKLQRVEATLLPMRENMVSVYAYVQRNKMLQTPSLDLHAQRIFIFCNKYRLFLNFNFHHFMTVVVHIEMV